MNLRQAQRALADLMAKCQEAHVQLPILELEDALDELKQTFGIDPLWLKREQEEQTKRANRQKRGRKPKSVYYDTAAAPKGSHSTSVSSASSGGASGPETSGSAATAAMSKGNGKDAASEEKQPTGRSTSKSQQQQQHKSPPPPKSKSRLDTVKQQNPAKNPENQELANEFVDLGGYELKHGERQKGVSRMNVAKQIRNTPEPLKSGTQARQIPGIGPSAAAKVDEILHHGKMRALEKFEASGGDEEGSGDDAGAQEENTQEV